MEIGPAQACAVKVVVQEILVTRILLFPQVLYYPLSQDPSLYDAWFTVSEETTLPFVSEAIALVQVSLQIRRRA